MKDKKIALLLGGNYLNEGILDKFRENNYYTIVVDWNKDPYLKGDLHLQIDIKDGGKIIEALDELQVNSANYVISYTSIDLAVPAVNIINKYYKKNSTSDISIENISSKENMIKCWSNDKLLNRVSFSISTVKELKKIVNKIKSKNILLKPSIGSSSRGLTVVSIDNLKEIYQAFEYAKTFSENDRVMVEEYIIGTEYTVELLGDNYGNVSVYGISKKYHTNNAGNNKIAVKLHFNPSDVSKECQIRIADFGIKCYKSLGLKNSFGHLEVIEQENSEIVPLEIGGRSSGFIASHLVSIVSGRDYIKDYISVINNLKILNGLLLDVNKSSMYYFYDFDNKSKSKSKSEANLMKYLEQSVVSLYSKRDNLVANKVFKSISNDIERYGYEILSGTTTNLTIEKVSFAEKEFLKEFFTKRIFYDAHAHEVGGQTGGFLIGLEGSPRFNSALTNSEVINKQDKQQLLYAVEYITKKFQKTTTAIIKYHPRREGYMPSAIIKDIKSRNPKIVLIDTLNQPNWNASDYWNIAIQFPSVKFLFCHAGGYDILEFIKMAQFQKNIWIDFSFTQEYFGCCDSNNILPIVCDTIKFAMKHPSISKYILFGSDYPMNSQDLQKKLYDNKEGERFLVSNFLELIKDL